MALISGDCVRDVFSWYSIVLGSCEAFVLMPGCLGGFFYAMKWDDAHVLLFYFCMSNYEVFIEEHFVL